MKKTLNLFILWKLCKSVGKNNEDERRLKFKIKCKTFFLEFFVKKCIKLIELSIKRFFAHIFIKWSVELISVVLLWRWLQESFKNYFILFYYFFLRLGNKKSRPPDDPNLISYIKWRHDWIMLDLGTWSMICEGRGFLKHQCFPTNRTRICYRKILQNRFDFDSKFNLILSELLSVWVPPLIIKNNC